MNVKDKVVVITGASSGIGRAAALAFAKKNAKVVLAARRLERLNALKEQIKSHDGECMVIKADVTKENDVMNLFAETERKFVQIDILINNAGRGLQKGLCDMEVEEWLSVIETNLTSVFLCTREAVRRMIKKGTRGHIITISSIAGLYGAPNYAAYCASKHGVTGFKRSIKWELRKQHIKVSTIHPARVDTEFFDVYKQRPKKRQMLSADDLALYILAIASRSLLKKTNIKISNLLKRIYYFVMKGK